VESIFFPTSGFRLRTSDIYSRYLSPGNPVKKNQNAKCKQSPERVTCIYKFGQLVTVTGKRNLYRRIYVKWWQSPGSHLGTSKMDQGNRPSDPLGSREPSDCV